MSCKMKSRTNVKNKYPGQPQIGFSFNGAKIKRFGRFEGLIGKAVVGLRYFNVYFFARMPKGIASRMESAVSSLVTTPRD